jgi:hypothetical protein
LFITSRLAFGEHLTDEEIARDERSGARNLMDFVLGRQQRRFRPAETHKSYCTTCCDMSPRCDNRESTGLFCYYACVWEGRPRPRPER